MTKSERFKRWYTKNRDKVLECHKEYRKNNKEKIAKYQSGWAIKNRDKRKPYNREWRIKNPNYHRDYARKNYIGYHDKKKTIRCVKRPYPNYCEVCNREQNRFLAYHHWDKNNLSKGMWLCNYCHCFAERVDGGFIDKYLILKNKLNNGGVNELDR
jgi:hypothetical protein